MPPACLYVQGARPAPEQPNPLSQPSQPIAPAIDTATATGIPVYAYYQPATIFTVQLQDIIEVMRSKLTEEMGFATELLKTFCEMGKSLPIGDAHGLAEVKRTMTEWRSATKERIYQIAGFIGSVQWYEATCPELSAIKNTAVQQARKTQGLLWKLRQLFLATMSTIQRGDSDELASFVQQFHVVQTELPQEIKLHELASFVEQFHVVKTGEALEISLGLPTDQLYNMDISLEEDEK